MKTRIFVAAACALLIATPAGANLCRSVRDTRTTAETARDVAFFEQLFPDATDRGDLSWNKIVVQCNRQRDTNGKEISRVTATSGGNAGKTQLLSRDLPAKAIRGHYNFFGTVVTQQKYVYALQKVAGEWIMTIPYRPIVNDVVKGRIDLNFSHAGKLYEASQVTGAPAAPVLTAAARPISATLCTTTTYFPGKANKYAGKRIDQRDKENSAISLGRIDYQYGKGGYAARGCRVDGAVDLYWRPDPGSTAVVRVKPGDWVQDNFVRTAESYWAMPGVFRLRLWLKGRNDSAIDATTRTLFDDGDRLTVRFATKFLPYEFNQMYKSNPIQFNNFSTMTTDGTYWHEVGHAFGLDDEYGGTTKAGIDKKNSCENGAYYDVLDAKHYIMCENTSEKRRIYPYIAVSRYVTKQK